MNAGQVNPPSMVALRRAEKYLMARILNTGGAGYVGSHCAKAAAMAGHECIVFDSLIFGHRDFVRWGPLDRG
jgi:nucleoside-diphosphate-sugar epimerase